jgi:surface antigen
MSDNDNHSSAITDEELVAFADGEADEATATRIEEALESDPALAERLEAFTATRRILRKHLGPVAQEPVPEHLTRFVMAGGVAPAAAGSTAPARPLPRASASIWRLPIAATVAALAAGSLGYLAGTTGNQGANGAFLPPLAAADTALNRALTGAADNTVVAWSDTASGRSGTLTIRASHKVRAGFCRTFGLADAAGARFGGVACRSGEGWRTEVVAAEGETTGGYAPASGMARAVDAFLDAAEADDPLPPAEVAQQITRGWR